MYHIALTIAQFLFTLWPLFIAAALLYSFQGRYGRWWLRNLARRIHTNLLSTWLVLAFVWVFTLFAPEPAAALLPEPYNTLLFLSGLALLLVIEGYRLRLFPRRLAARINLHDAHRLTDLKRMDPGQFEELVAETYRALGYSASRTGKSGDHGIDVEVRTDDGRRWVVQCKRYRETVGESTVRELYGTMVAERANRAVLVTSASITAPAETWARGKPIDLVDGPAFLRMIDQARRQSRGSLIDRFARWLERTVLAPRIPPALRPDVPVCPLCGSAMIPHPKQPGRGLYRCTRYPTCRGVANG